VTRHRKIRIREQLFVNIRVNCSLIPALTTLGKRCFHKFVRHEIRHGVRIHETNLNCSGGDV